MPSVAQAEPVPYKCQPKAAVFELESDGHVWVTTVTNAGGDPDFDGRVDAGLRKGYGKLVGGKDGVVYGIDPKAGLFRNRWLKNHWEDDVDKKISDGFLSYGKEGRFNSLITADETGAIFVVDATGKLRTFREAKSGSGLTQRVLAGDWGRFDSIQAAGDGVLYARTSDGQLYRSRWDSISDRWIELERPVGSGWQRFSGMFSVGGDVLFGYDQTAIEPFRYDEGTRAWDKSSKTTTIYNVPVPGKPARKIGFSGVSDGCTLGVSRTPDQPAATIDRHAPVAVMQPARQGQNNSDIHYAFTQADGTVQVGTHTPDGGTEPTRWQPLDQKVAFAGAPAFVGTADGKVEILGRDVKSSIRARVRGELDWGDWRELSGRMASDPVPVRLSDGCLLIAALDSTGRVWFRQITVDGKDEQSFPWLCADAAGSPSLVGGLKLVAGEDGSADIFGIDKNGKIRTAHVKDGLLGAWSELGGDGFSGSMSIVVHPGTYLRVIARDKNGKMVTQKADVAGKFSGSWTPVGDKVFDGSPAAVLDPKSGKVIVVARANDNFLYRADESSIGAGTFQDWRLLEKDTSPTPVVTDPTGLTVSSSSGMYSIFVARNENQAVIQFSSQDPAAIRADVAFKHEIVRGASRAFKP